MLTGDRLQYGRPHVGSACHSVAQLRGSVCTGEGICRVRWKWNVGGLGWVGVGFQPATALQYILQCVVPLQSEQRNGH